MASSSASAEHTKPRPCFGRQADLAYLLDRSKSTGLTAVVGPAQAGKTRLFQETRDGLRDEGSVVGYAESTGDHRDLLLRALTDAYARACAAGKLRALLERAFENRSGILAEVPAALLAAVLPGELQGVLDLTKRAAAETGSTGLELPRITHDDALGLVSFLATVSERPIVLFLDAWQKCSPVAQAAAPLQRFLDHADAWPACHVFLGVGSEDAPYEEARDCLTELEQGSRLAEVHVLGGMDLSDPGESRRLLDHLADEVPAIRDTSPPLALKLIDGSPGVLHRWLEIKPESAQVLERAAADARLNSYPELRELFLEQCRSAPRVACFLAALAILPQMNDESVWRPLSCVLLRDLDRDTVWTLQADGILEAVDGAEGVPSYGHDTRHDAAGRSWLSDDEPVLKPLARSEVKRLIPDLAEYVADLGGESSVFAAALASILEHQAELQLKGSLLFLCEYAASLLSSWTTSLDPGLLADKAAETARDHPRAATLVALALANIQCRAGRRGDRARGDALLKELHGLCARHPEDEAVRERLAVALVDAANAACQRGDRARDDALLKELRGLCARHPRDAAVRERLAAALVDAAHAASQTGEGARTVLDELRRLCAEHPGDAAVRERLATALADAVNTASRDEGEYGCGAPLDELRRLYAVHPGDAAVRERLATALVDAVGQASHEGHPAGRDAFFEELRRMHAEHPGDAAVRERLAAALLNALNQALQEEYPARRDALLKELRRLSAEHPEDAPVRERLGAALYRIVVHICHAKDRPRRDALLDELRRLCARHPEDAALHERLNMALFNMPALLAHDED